MTTTTITTPSMICTPTIMTTITTTSTSTRSFTRLSRTCQSQWQTCQVLTSKLASEGPPTTSRVLTSLQDSSSHPRLATKSHLRLVISSRPRSEGKSSHGRRTEVPRGVPKSK